MESQQPRFSVLGLARARGAVGFNPSWLAERHNLPGIASAATSVLIGYVEGGTSTLRVGSGGIMLPSHSSLIIAEQFGTLETLYPGRIDLGVGRAPGGDAAAEELPVTTAVSVGGFIIFLPLENCLKVALSMQNANHAQGIRLNDVEDENVFKAFHGPEA